MTAEQLLALKTLIGSEPANVTRSDAQVAHWCNEQTGSKFTERFITDRRVYNEFGATRGEAILGAFEAAALVSSVAARVLGWLRSSIGVDVGSALSHQMIDTWVTSGLLTNTEGTQLKNLGLAPCGRAEALGLGVISAQDVIDALRN